MPQDAVDRYVEPHIAARRVKRSAETVRRWCRLDLVEHQELPALKRPRVLVGVDARGFPVSSRGQRQR